MGRVVTMKKKWWMLAVVFALALSLTSCSRRGSGQFSNYGVNYCDGTLGQIDVYTVASGSQAGTFQVVLIPISLTAPGDVVTVTAVNQGTLAYKTLLQEVALNVNQEITAGYLTESELQNYDMIAITSYIGGVDFLSANPAKDAICGLPLVGDGVNSTPAR